MLLNNRLIWKDDSVLKDLSINLNNIHASTETLALVAAEDYLYIGSDLPFNHRYFEVTTANSLASSVSVELWNNSSWVNAVDVLDQTKSTAGATLSQSGIISWVPDKDEVWVVEDTTEDIPDLSTLKIYNMYWARLSFSADLTATTALNYVGHKFATETEMGGFYPELILTATKTAFQTGKTTWNVQLVEAAETIVRDLRKKGIIWSRNQILDWEKFSEANIHKCAEIIFRAFGDNENDQLKLSQMAYKEALYQQVFNVDKDQDGRLDKHEKIIAKGLIRR